MSKKIVSPEVCRKFSPNGWEVLNKTFTRPLFVRIYVKWHNFIQLKAKDVLPNINLTQAAERAEKCRFCSWWPWTLTFDLWHWHSNSTERGTKHVFPVNLAQIRSAVPKIFHIKTKKSRTDSAKNRTLRSSQRVVIISNSDKIMPYSARPSNEYRYSLQ